MSLDFSLDASYRINPHIVTSIKGPGSIAVFGPGIALELSLSLLQVVMAFAEATSARRAYQTLDVDVDVEQFGRIVSDFAEHGLLLREQDSEDEPDLSQMLTPRVFADAALVEKIGGWMREGRAIMIPDALPEEFAEEVHRDLDLSTRWTLSEGGHDFFHYRNSTIGQLDGLTAALTRCTRLFTSAATRRFVAKISGQDCAGEAHVTASWYRPCEYALPHDDATGNSMRSVAYIWYLTKNWRCDWGGTLFWCPTGQYVSPGFNVLVIFNSLASNLHLVCPVSPAATAKRLTINGFWHRSERRPQPTPPAPSSLVSPPAYGARAADSQKEASIIVL
jgi:Rps23 Pro-64 3,4-dihydroxylase Tpa1-like proline 4-hydroxylase